MKSEKRIVKSTKKKKPLTRLFFLEAPPGIGPGNKGFADLCLTAWLWRLMKLRTRISLIRARLWSGLRGSNPPPRPWQGRALPNELNPHINGASDRNRTNDTGIFSPLLYQLSYRGKILLFARLATRMGLEPTTSSVTG